MQFDNLCDLPEWKEVPSFPGEEGEDWKSGATREACKALYRKWGEIIRLMRTALETLPEDVEAATGMPEDFWQGLVGAVVGDAYNAGIKIQSSEAGDLFVLRMENAAIIRQNAQFVASGLLTLGLQGLVDEAYVEAIRAEILQFRSLFRDWLQTFRRDEYADEWGLFV